MTSSCPSWRKGQRKQEIFLSEKFEKSGGEDPLKCWKSEEKGQARFFPHYTYADLAKLLKLPILVVASNRLGVINHLLLTLEHASSRGLRVFGYVFNRLDTQPSLAAETNAEALFSLTSVPCLGEIPHMEDLEARRSSLGGLCAQLLDLSQLVPVLRTGAVSHST